MAAPAGWGPYCGPATRSRERGNILVLFALLLPVFLVCCAIAIDVGYWWANGKKAQIAADACALAAAHELPETYALNHCVIDAGSPDYVAANLPDEASPDRGTRRLSTSVISPYNSDPRLVEATVELRVRTFFGVFVGVKYIDLTRRAVAERLDAEGRLAIFTATTDCANGLEFNGLNISVNGHVHSNGEYHVNSGHAPDNFWAADGTIAKGPPPADNCIASLDPEPDGAQYGDGEDFLPRDGDELQWPEWWSPADFGYYEPAVLPATGGKCTYKGLKIDISSTQVKVTSPDQTIDYSGAIPTGTYCATESVIIGATGTAANPIDGQITLLAPEVKVNGDHVDFSPHQGGVLFFTVPNVTSSTTDDGQFNPSVASPTDIPPYIPCLPAPSKEMQLDGNHYRWAGVIFNPCGRVLLNNHDSTIGNEDLVGTIYGWQVRINGSGFDMVGTGETESEVLTALVE